MVSEGLRKRALSFFGTASPSAYERGVENPDSNINCLILCQLKNEIAQA